MRKEIAIFITSLVVANPAFAGGFRGGSLLGGVVVPVSTVVSALNVQALNNVSILNGNKTSILNGNGFVTTAKIGPVSISSGGHGCGCN